MFLIGEVVKDYD